jgi:hypothetical protein
MEEPMAMTGNFLTRDLHVGASPRDCVRHVYAKLRPELRRQPSLKDARKEVYREALAAHAGHQKLVAQFRL